MVDERKIWIGGVKSGLLLSPSLWACWVPFSVLNTCEVSSESDELSESLDSPISNSEWHLAKFYLIKYLGFIY